MISSALEEKFRALRGEARAPAQTFAQDLFLGLPPFLEAASAGPVLTTVAPQNPAPAPVRAPEVAPKPVEIKKVETTAPAQNSSTSEVEFEKTMRSLEGFATKNSDERGQVKFAGGKLSVKEATSFEINSELATASLFEGEGKGASELKCAFIGHRLGSEWGEYDVNEEAEQMLSRMISAMKLSPTDYVLSPFKRQVSDPESDPYWQSLLMELFNHKPKVIFLMGANVTATFMGKKERISKLHGQVIRRDFKLGTQVHSMNLMPIFHPEYLLINSGMKRAAWEDFQRAMEIMEK